MHAAAELSCAAMHAAEVPSLVRCFTGLAFSEGERERLYLRGLLPPAVLSQEVQAERALINIAPSPPIWSATPTSPPSRRARFGLCCKDTAAVLMLVTT